MVDFKQLEEEIEELKAIYFRLLSEEKEYFLKKISELNAK